MCNSLPLVFSRVERLWRTGRLHSIPEGGGDQGTQTWDAHIRTITSKHINIKSIFSVTCECRKKGMTSLCMISEPKSRPTATTWTGRVELVWGLAIWRACHACHVGMCCQDAWRIWRGDLFHLNFGGGLSILHLFSGYPEVGQETSKCRKRVSILVESGETCLHALSAQHHSPRTVQPKQVSNLR